MRAFIDLSKVPIIRNAGFILSSLGVLLIAVCTGLVQAQTDTKENQSEGVELVAKPASCVALHRGQVCFQRIVFSWEAADYKQYCLYKKNEAAPLFCAAGSQAGIVHEYASKSSETFILRLGNEAPVAMLTINTAWVYRTGRRSSSSWRLF